MRLARRAAAFPLPFLASPDVLRTADSLWTAYSRTPNLRPKGRKCLLCAMAILSGPTSASTARRALCTPGGLGLGCNGRRGNQLWKPRVCICRGEGGWALAQSSGFEPRHTKIGMTRPRAISIDVSDQPRRRIRYISCDNSAHIPRRCPGGVEVVRSEELRKVGTCRPNRVSPPVNGSWCPRKEEQWKRTSDRRTSHVFRKCRLCCSNRCNRGLQCRLSHRLWTGRCYLHGRAACGTPRNRRDAVVVSIENCIVVDFHRSPLCGTLLPIRDNRHSTLSRC